MYPVLHSILCSPVADSQSVWSSRGRVHAANQAEVPSGTWRGQVTLSQAQSGMVGMESTPKAFPFGGSAVLGAGRGSQHEPSNLGRPYADSAQRGAGHL